MNKRDWLTTAELSKRWGLSVGTLRNWRWRGQGPRWETIGTAVVYNLWTVITFEDDFPDLIKPRPKCRRQTREA